MSDEITAKSKRGYQRSGFYSLKAAVKRDGLAAVDGRSAVARAIKTWRENVEADRGGAAELSTIKHTALDLCETDLLLIAEVERFLREDPRRALNRKKRAMAPLIRERSALIASFWSRLKDVGLDRVPKPIPSLEELFAEHDAAQSEREGAATDESDAPEIVRPGGSSEAEDGE